MSSEDKAFVTFIVAVVLFLLSLGHDRRAAGGGMSSEDKAFVTFIVAVVLFLLSIVGAFVYADKQNHVLFGQLVERGVTPLEARCVAFNRCEQGKER